MCFVLNDWILLYASEDLTIYGCAAWGMIASCKQPPPLVPLNLVTHPVDEDVAWQSCIGLLQAAEAVHHLAVVKGLRDLRQTTSWSTKQQNITALRTAEDGLQQQASLYLNSKNSWRRCVRDSRAIRLLNICVSYTNLGHNLKWMRCNQNLCSSQFIVNISESPNQGHFSTEPLFCIFCHKSKYMGGQYRELLLPPHGQSSSYCITSMESTFVHYSLLSNWLS